MSDRAALEALAATFVWELERLDPSGRFELERGREAIWRSLTDGERAYYVEALGATLKNRKLVEEAISNRLAEDDAIDRC
jgi:hypothetical protein